MLRFREVFRKEGCAVIGMIHVAALPGTPRYEGSTDKILAHAIHDAKIYAQCGIDGVLVENMHDLPYVRSSDSSPETTAFMSRVCTEVRKIIPRNIPCGVQILAGCNKEAVAVAKAAEFQFVRAEGFVFSHIADEGFTDANAGPLLRYRRQIDAQDVLIFVDVKKKHSSHAVTADVSLAETIKAAEFFLADGVVLTGTATGQPADPRDLREVRKSSRGPVLIGSGVNLDNLSDYLTSDAVIVGTHFKVNDDWKNPVDKEAVKRFLAKMRFANNN